MGKRKKQARKRSSTGAARKTCCVYFPTQFVHIDYPKWMGNFILPLYPTNDLSAKFTTLHTPGTSKNPYCFDEVRKSLPDFSDFIKILKIY